MKTCPCCGRAVVNAPASLVDAVDALRLPRRQRRIVDALIAAFPRTISKDDLVPAVWDHLDDEPEFPGDVLESHVSKLRQALRPHGWSVDGVRMAGYRLIEVAA